MRKIDKKLNSLILVVLILIVEVLINFDNSPQILQSGNGPYVFDNNNNKFLDYGMGLRSVILGYSNKKLIKLRLKQFKVVTI